MEDITDNDDILARCWTYKLEVHLKFMASKIVQKAKLRLLHIFSWTKNEMKRVFFKIFSFTSFLKYSYQVSSIYFFLNIYVYINIEQKLFDYLFGIFFLGFNSILHFCFFSFVWTHR